MKKIPFLIATAIVCGPVSADEFDFELSLDFDAVDRTRSFSSDFLRQVRDDDTQELDVRFRWYIDGLSDERGPRGVAAFTNRASFVDFGLFQSNTSSDVIQITDDQTFNVSGTTDTDGFSLSGRYVFENWFVSGAYSDIDAESTFRVLRTFELGVGRYIAQDTAISLGVARAEIERNGIEGTTDTDNGAILGLTHIGELGTVWDYGVVLAVSNQSLSDSNGSYSADFSLFPSRDIGISVGVAGQLGASSREATQYSLSAGWFILEQLEISAEIGLTEIDRTGSLEEDEERYGIDVLYRF